MSYGIMNNVSRLDGTLLFRNTTRFLSNIYWEGETLIFQSSGVAMVEIQSNAIYNKRNEKY